jgi:hypothetical protein
LQTYAGNCQPNSSAKDFEHFVIFRTPPYKLRPSSYKTRTSLTWPGGKNANFAKYTNFANFAKTAKPAYTPTIFSPQAYNCPATTTDQANPRDYPTTKKR